MRDFRRMQVLIALLRDGFHARSPGGTVRLRDDGTPVLDYPLTPFVWDGVRRAFLAMAEIQFAAGAHAASRPRMASARRSRASPTAKAAIAAFDLRPLYTRVVSAHVMGGAPFGADPRRVGRRASTAAIITCATCTCATGRSFPTSIGANPQLSIYAFARAHRRRRSPSHH